MGALTSNRKRKDECFKLNSPILGFNSSDSNFDYFRDRIDCHIAKKARVSYCEGASEVVDTAERVVSRLRRYPEPEKLKREVHAPCRSSRVGFLSGRSGWENSGIRDKVALMGNALFAEFNRKKNVALNALKHIRYGSEKEVIDVDSEEEAKSGGSKDLWEVEVIEDGNEVRSVVSEDCRGVENDVVELDRKGVERGSVRGFSIVPDLVKVEDDYKSLGSMSLDREAYKNLLSRVERTRTVKLNDLHFEITSVEARLQSIRLEKPKERKFIDLVEPEEDLLREPFVPLTEEEGREVARALSQNNRRKILVSHENSNIDITGEMLQCLRPGAWLNDEVINLYLELLKEREKREQKKFLKCHFFNTFFYKKLVGGRSGYDYKAVRRWTTQRKLGYELMDCDKIFVPVHKEVHWCLAVINKKDKSLQYLDSLGGRDHQVLRALARYFMDEVKDKSGKDIDVSSWDQEFVEDLPEQQNGFDCGVFMIKYVDFYSRGLGLHFSQENMPYFRLRTAKEILKLRAD